MLLPTAYGNEQVVIGNMPVLGKARVADDYGVTFYVYGLYLGTINVGVWAEAPNGVDNVGRLYAPGDHFSQHRLEQEKVVPAHEGQLYSLSFCGVLQLEGSVNATISPTYDHHLRRTFVVDTCSLGYASQHQFLMSHFLTPLSLEAEKEAMHTSTQSTRFW